MMNRVRVYSGLTKPRILVTSNLGFLLGNALDFWLTKIVNTFPKKVMAKP
jgi:hypothetical protein